MLQLPLPTLDPDVMTVGVVLPVFSETETVGPVCQGLVEILGDRLVEIRIILSPRSSDESRRICEDLARRDDRVRISIQENNPGLGWAVREGYAAVGGDWILNMDSDGEMELDTVRRMWERARELDVDLVLANRWGRGGGFEGYDPLKKVLNWGYQQLFRVLFLTRMSDLTYGYKLMRGEFARGLTWQGTLHEIATETTLRPIRVGARVAQVPSRWTRRVEGRSKNTFWRNFRYVRTAVAVWIERGST